MYVPSDVRQRFPLPGTVIQPGLYFCGTADPPMLHSISIGTSASSKIGIVRLYLFRTQSVRVTRVGS